MDDKQVAEYLNNLPSGLLPLPVFLAIARLVVLSVVELVPFHFNNDGEVEVLLIQRPESDVWSGQWHTPGVVILPTDRMDAGDDFSQPLERILHGELEGMQTVGQPKQLYTERRRNARGDELAVVHAVEVTGEPTKGRYFALKDFPDNVPDNGMVPHHIEMIQKAAELFQKS